MKDGFNAISFLGHPFLWLKNKYLNGLSLGNLTMISVLPSAFAILNLFGSYFTIRSFAVGDLSGPSIVNSLLIALILYGIINIVISVEVVRVGARLQEERGYYNVMHKNIVEVLRDYRAYKCSCMTCIDGTRILDERYIKGVLRGMLNSFNDNYMKKRYSPKVVTTVKYMYNNYLYPIRVGYKEEYRSKERESAELSYVYKALSGPSKLQYIYVKDLEKPDSVEAMAMGQFTEKIVSRAADNYKTFIALPIRGGRIEFENNPDEVEVRPDLGVLGFDLRDKYRFGNFEQHELDYMACLADSLSEVILDLLEVLVKSEKKII